MEFANIFEGSVWHLFATYQKLLIVAKWIFLLMLGAKMSPEKRMSGSFSWWLFIAVTNLPNEKKFYWIANQIQSKKCRETGKFSIQVFWNRVNPWKKKYETKGHQPSRPTDRLDLPGLDVVDIVEVEDGDRLCLLPRHHPLRVHSRLQQIISIKKCANQKLCLHCTTLTTLLIDSELYPRWYYS